MKTNLILLKHDGKINLIIENYNNLYRVIPKNIIYTYYKTLISFDKIIGVIYELFEKNKNLYYIMQ